MIDASIWIYGKRLKAEFVRRSDGTPDIVKLTCDDPDTLHRVTIYFAASALPELETLGRLAAHIRELRERGLVETEAENDAQD